VPEIGSDAWIDEFARSLAGIDAAGVEITVLHRIVDGPAWLVTAARDRVTVTAAGPGAAHDADVTFKWHRDDAEAVSSGRATALVAFQAGRLRVGGDLRRLREAAALFTRFPAVERNGA
jgi:alkyl sulfatase BDS1-like metallo-beta-lactamase superfamily hydrolase